MADGGVHFNLVGSTDAERKAALREAVLGPGGRRLRRQLHGEYGLGRAFQDAYDRFTPRLVQDYSAAVAAVFGQGSAAVRPEACGDQLGYAKNLRSSRRKPGPADCPISLLDDRAAAASVPQARHRVPARTG